MSRKEYSVAAVVVTYNRKHLLRKCLQALLAQTRPIDEIIVVDNASTDGTAEMLAMEFPEVTVLRLSENVGGAGGFAKGMQLAYDKQHDWIWTMDDDAIPDAEALSSLISTDVFQGDQIGLLCSHVVWIDGSPHRMNIPRIKPLPDIDRYIDKGVIPISHCSFVSVLVSRRAIEVVGLPIKEMFIHSDDVEFTGRICRVFPCYYVVRSRVVHRTSVNMGSDIAKTPSNQLWRHYYSVRNRTYICRTEGFPSLIKFYLLDIPRLIFRVTRRKEKRIEAIKVCFKGIIAGIAFYPKIEWPNRPNN